MFKNRVGSSLTIAKLYLVYVSSSNLLHHYGRDQNTIRCQPQLAVPPVVFSEVDKLDGKRIEQYRESHGGLMKKSQQKLLMHTRVHDAIIEDLLLRADRMTQGKFCGHNGTHTSLLQGPKGIGKTSVLKSFVEVSPVLYPKIITIYLSYDQLKATGSLLKELTIAQLVERKLKAWNIIPTNINNNDNNLDDVLLEKIVRSLQENDKYVMLIVNEIDQLYKVSKNSGEKVLDTAQTNLYDLVYLGNQESGRFGVFLCGSSASCPLLVTANAGVRKDQFPLIDGAPNMNGKKYKTRRLPLTLFTDVSAVELILKELGYQHVSQCTARFVTFIVGTAPRDINSLMRQAASTDLDIYSALRNNNHESFIDTGDWMFAKSFLHILLQKLAEKNTAMKAMITVNNVHVSPDRVAREKWETVFKPLQLDEVMDAYRIACDSHCGENMVERDRMRHDKEYLQASIFLLCDKGLLTFDEIDQGLPKHLYPSAPAQVFVDLLDDDATQNFKYRANDILRGIGKDIYNECVKQGVESIIIPK